MARRKQKDNSAGVGLLPVELLDIGDEAWASEFETMVWLETHGLTLRSEVGLSRGPNTRHDRAVRAWALEHGWTRQAGGAPHWTDWQRLYAAGIPPGRYQARLGEAMAGVAIVGSVKARSKKVRKG